MYKQINSTHIKLLILITIVINFLGAFYPILRNDDPVLYASISKNMVLSGNWLNLIYDQKDWLDKPHFPFWVTGLSFKLFGINSFAYILPGFLFHLLGAVFTYLLSIELYKNRQIALIATLIYVSSLHLLISSIDVRAEAYLLGEIMGACYFWYKYDKSTEFSLKYLVLGSIFTACAIMTKGPFVIITIGSGFVFMWMYQKRLNNLYSIKWLLALILSLLFTFPEVYALYQQFDIHPEKIIFGKDNVSGVSWFFWGSQFGRFFNNGEIKVNHVQNFHYLFFVHTFLWAFLPWSVFFIFAKIVSFRGFSKKSNVSRDINSNSIFILGAFLPTFIMFSLTKFQLDHYTNILMPFAAILCAKWYDDMRSKDTKETRWVFYFQVGLATLFLVLATLLILFLLNGFSLTLALLIDIIVIMLLIYYRKLYVIDRALIMSVLAINMVFVLITQINQKYVYYDPGYLAAQIVNRQEKVYPVVDYGVNSVTFDFYSKQSYRKVFDLDEIKTLPHPMYMVIRTSDTTYLDQKNIHYVTISHIQGMTIYELMAGLINPDKLVDHLVDYSVLEIK